MNKYLACLPTCLLLLLTPLRAADPAPAASPSPSPASESGALPFLPPPKILPFPQDESDLKPDPNARFGTLPNGLRYVILPNHEPRGRVSLRLLVLAGSLEEKEDQRGLAHYLEHMAFNGSTHFPLDTSTNPPTPTLVEFLQHFGMGFGGDTNASTSFDRTLYLLELPRADDKTLAKGLEVFADYAGGLLLLDDMVDKERGIILSEKRVRDTVSYRTFVAEFESMLGDTLIPKRMPIGEADIITAAKRDRFVDFWNTWYRPEKMVVIVVGDIADPAAVEKLVKDACSGLAPRVPAQPTPSLGELAHFDGVKSFFHADAELPSTDVSITTITPYTHEPDTAAHELKLLPRSLAVSMLNQRFAQLAKKEDAPFTAASVSIGEQFNFYHEASVDVTCKPDQWQAALDMGEQELRRALTHGFSDDELKRASASFLNELDHAAKSASTRSSKALATELAQSLLDGNVFTSPEQDLALFKPALDKITAKDCLEALRAAFATNGRYVMVAGNLKIDGDASGVITAAYKKSQSVAVAPWHEEKQAEWAYANFGAPGKVVERKHIDDLDIDLVTFSNGVRLNIKKTDFEAGTVKLGARIGGGVVTEPLGQRGLSAFAGATFDAGGLGKHSVDDLERLFAGKNIELGFAPAADAFTFAGTTTADDLQLEMQFLAAKITDPGYRPESLREARKGFEQMYNMYDHTSAGPLRIEVANIIAGGDPRIGLPPREVMMQRNLDEVKAWLAPQFASAPLEVALVGDLNVDAAIDAAAKTIGALPTRGPRPDLATLEKITFPPNPFVKDYTILTEIPKTQLALFWPTNDGIDIHRRRRLTVLAAVFSDRLRVQVREKIGGSYSPRAMSDASETFPAYGYIEANIDVDPAMAGKISDAAVAAADDLATKGLTEDELARVRLPMQTALKESLRSNDYWLMNVLSRAQEKPEMLDWVRTRMDDFNSISVDELDALAKQYFGRFRVSRVTIAPASTPKPAGGEPAPSEVK